MSVSSQPRPESVARRLERAIQSGQFKPAQPLPSERALAARWKLSRSIVREGIAMLVAKGLLNRRHGSGTYVNEPDRQLGAQIWGRLASGATDLQSDLLEFRHMLECEASALAARRHGGADRTRLQAAGAAVEEAWAGGDRRQQLGTDLAFHHAIAEATHNAIFISLMSSLHRMLLDHMQVSQAGMQMRSSVTEQVRLQHRVMLQAILARDADAAAKAASTHLDYVRVRLNHMAPRAR
jgi:DNA-binding FadR family transcriptional regulator